MDSNISDLHESILKENNVIRLPINMNISSNQNIQFNKYHPSSLRWILIYNYLNVSECFLGYYLR